MGDVFKNCILNDVKFVPTIQIFFSLQIIIAKFSLIEDN